MKCSLRCSAICEIAMCYISPLSAGSGNSYQSVTMVGQCVLFKGHGCNREPGDGGAICSLAGRQNVLERSGMGMVRDCFRVRVQSTVAGWHTIPSIVIALGIVMAPKLYCDEKNNNCVDCGGDHPDPACPWCATLLT